MYFFIFLCVYLAFNYSKAIKKKNVLIIFLKKNKRLNFFYFEFLEN
jgi:hypothetical protein